MNSSTILGFASLGMSLLSLCGGAVGILAQAQGGNVDWLGGGSVTLIVAGTIGMALGRLVQGILKLEQTRQDREAAREARDSRTRELQSNVDTLTIMVAVTRAELSVWKKHCQGQPPLRSIRAAQERARKNPEEFVDDTVSEDA